jgi:hypothetical protein
MCKIIVKFIITFPITEKRLLKFGFKKTRNGFRNGQGVYVKDRHMNDTGNFSDTFYLDILSGEIVFSNVGNAGAPLSEHVKNMYELKQFYEKHKSKISYPDETSNVLIENKSILTSDEIELIYEERKFQVIKSIKNRLNITLLEAKNIVDEYIKRNNL